MGAKEAFSKEVFFFFYIFFFIILPPRVRAFCFAPSLPLTRWLNWAGQAKDVLASFVHSPQLTAHALSPSASTAPDCAADIPLPTLDSSPSDSTLLVYLPCEAIEIKQPVGQTAQSLTHLSHPSPQSVLLLARPLSHSQDAYVSFILIRPSSRETKRRPTTRFGLWYHGIRPSIRN